jgi:hypothetical protein
LASVLRGRDAYYDLPSYWHWLETSYDEVRRIWYRVLKSSQSAVAVPVAVRVIA